MTKDLIDMKMILQWLWKIKKGSRAHLITILNQAMADNLDYVKVNIYTKWRKRGELPIDYLQAILEITSDAFTNIDLDYLTALTDLQSFPVTTVEVGEKEWEIPFLGEVDQASLQGIYELISDYYLSEVLTNRLNICLRIQQKVFSFNRDNLIEMMINDKKIGQVLPIKMDDKSSINDISIPIMRGPWIGQTQTWFREGINAWYENKVPCLLETKGSPIFKEIFPAESFIVETQTGQVYVAKVVQTNLDTTLQFLTGSIFEFVKQSLGIETTQPISKKQLITANKEVVKFKKIDSGRYLMSM